MVWEISRCPECDHSCSLSCLLVTVSLRAHVNWALACNVPGWWASWRSFQPETRDQSYIETCVIVCRSCIVPSNTEDGVTMKAFKSPLFCLHILVEWCTSLQVGQRAACIINETDVYCCLVSFSLGDTSCCPLLFLYHTLWHAETRLHNFLRGRALTVHNVSMLTDTVTAVLQF